MNVARTQGDFRESVRSRHREMALNHMLAYSVGLAHRSTLEQVQRESLVSFCGPDSRNLMKDQGLRATPTKAGRNNRSLIV